uniref:C-type lectin domain-containing protein n=1 Tax=Electrophorus electricus TaxID=8005 RepID=A0AAY5F4F5_ELEEL
MPYPIKVYYYWITWMNPKLSSFSLAYIMLVNVIQMEKPNESLVLIADYKNWTEAQRYCREHHTDLASIKNQDENSRIASLVGQNFVWIGLHRTRTWSDQSNSSFRYWKTEHVNSRLEDLSPACTAVSLGDLGRWIEENCNITLPFICYSGNFSG